jgi:hypothetical protein
METLSQLLSAMRANGVTRILAKKLAPNDNSKNQIYLGGDFSALSLLPHGEVEVDSSELAGSVRDRAKASMDFYWMEGGCVYQAPAAQLILYPRFPEVRLSGLLKGCAAAPSSVLRVRDEGRVLILGATPDGRVISFAAGADHPIGREIASLQDPERVGVFLVLQMSDSTVGDTRHQLIAELRRVHEMGWIGSRRLDSAGASIPYVARNGGGLTLEAELGIRPNGRAEPDYLGWEVKQYGVSSLFMMRALSLITLMTPEPSAGLYADEGAESFIRKFGYADRGGRSDRMNFGGDYRVGRGPHPLTGLSLVVRGYDPTENRITDMAGDLALMNTDGIVAAAWPFTTLMAHWTHKHARAVYVPSVRRPEPPAYAFGNIVSLFAKADFLLFLSALSLGVVKYDPALKIEGSSSGRPRIKKRNQFRTWYTDLSALYGAGEVVDVVTGAQVDSDRVLSSPH